MTSPSRIEKKIDCHFEADSSKKDHTSMFEKPSTFILNIKTKNKEIQLITFKYFLY